MRNQRRNLLSLCPSKGALLRAASEFHDDCACGHLFQIGTKRQREREREREREAVYLALLSFLSILSFFLAADRPKAASLSTYWVFTEFALDLLGFYRVSFLFCSFAALFSRFYRVSLGFTGFYRVSFLFVPLQRCSRDFTEFY